VDAIYITVLLLLRAVAEPASNQWGGADEPKAIEQGENCTNSVIIKLYIYILIMGALYTLVT
jgi:hypothetical protein